PLTVTGAARRRAALPVAGTLLTAAALTAARRPDRLLAAFADATGSDPAVRADPANRALAEETARRFRATPVAVLARSAARALRADPLALAARPAQPTLVLVGEEDRVGPPDEAAAVARALPHGRLLVLPRCGHFPFVERPLDTLDALVRHLRGAPPPSTIPL
ncbi:MAG: alpha/beta hydrolase, partial [Actinomycetota bacterium]